MVDPFGLVNIIAEYNGSGTLVNRYAYGYGLTAANDNLYTFDGNGNTSELTNASGQLVNKYLYEPFGGSLYKSETSTNDFEFVGQLGVMNLGNDLLYMRNRFYTPTLGRFMNEDPIGLAGGDVSFYRYVLNDPVNALDPWGLKECTEICSLKKGEFKSNVLDHYLGGGPASSLTWYETCPQSYPIFDSACLVSTGKPPFSPNHPFPW